ncbi:MAG TPA: GNAT family N-acetyltransferase [Bacillota bacterium]|nr:GNAT family N-acetyltransferase [Bacillota bacterium]
MPTIFASARGGTAGGFNLLGGFFILHRICLPQYTVTEESFPSIRELYNREKLLPEPPSIFVTPAWLETWWQAFGEGAAAALLAVRQNRRVAGLAPLMIRGKEASFMGSPAVCDYLDFWAAPGEEEPVAAAVLNHLMQKGINKLDLHSLHPGSAALAGLPGAAKALGWSCECTREAVSVGLELPPTWEGYLDALTKKQRHEVRRKLRRLEEAGPYRYRVITGEKALAFIPLFLDMFTRNPEKANFLTGAVAIFFPGALKAAVQSGPGRFGLLELAGRVAAAVFYFDFRGNDYLYNSAYDPEFRNVSAGLLCKVLHIKDAIARGRGFYDFLRGGEEYKYRLGGRDIPIYRCSVARLERPHNPAGGRT